MASGMVREVGLWLGSIGADLMAFSCFPYVPRFGECLKSLLVREFHYGCLAASGEFVLSHSMTPRPGYNLDDTLAQQYNPGKDG